MKFQRFEVIHSSVYDYESTVFLSHNLLCLAPRRRDGQCPLEHTLEFTPPALAPSAHIDYFGNKVCYATIAEAHRQLRVVSKSIVAVGPSDIPEPDETLSWERVRAFCRADLSNKTLEAAEFTFPSAHVPVAAPYAEYARPSFPAGRPILEAVLALTGCIYRDFRFDGRATTIATPLEEVLKNRRGVCQDFAHLEIACLRSLGLPARYVSGYIETVPPPGKEKLAGADASHAWLSFFSPGMGWIDVDPTNNVLPSMQHITVAWGRDYWDVSPLRGVASGGGAHRLAVGVNVVAQGVYEPAGAG